MGPATLDPALRGVFAPTGTLRAAINLGNPILANADAQGQAFGISVDLARELGGRLGVPVELNVVKTAAASVDLVTNGPADIGFFAIDPVRGAGIAFTAAYVLIEGCYLVAEASPLKANEEVDRAGTRIAVGQGSAYDLYLTREIKNATLVRAPSSPLVVDTFVQQKLDVAAGVKQQLEADAKRIGGLRLLPGRFMVIQPAMGVAKTRGEAAAAVRARSADPEAALGVADDFLAGCGWLLMAWAWCVSSRAAREGDTPWHAERASLAQHGVDWWLPQAAVHWARVQAGAPLGAVEA